MTVTLLPVLASHAAAAAFTAFVSASPDDPNISCRVTGFAFGVAGPPPLAALEAPLAGVEAPAGVDAPPAVATGALGEPLAAPGLVDLLLLHAAASTASTTVLAASVLILAMSLAMEVASFWLRCYRVEGTALTNDERRREQNMGNSGFVTREDSGEQSDDLRTNLFEGLPHARQSRLKQSGDLAVVEAHEGDVTADLEARRSGLV
jgi:hypothetical protein